MTRFKYFLLSLIVFALPALGQSNQITDLTQATVGEKYQASLDIHVERPFRLKVTSNSLPQGLSLKDDGTFDGAPVSAAVGTQIFGITITDANGRAEERIFRVKIAQPAPVPVTPVEDVCGESHIKNNLSLNDRCFNDLKENFQIIGGVEQSGVASLPNQTNAFLSAFTRGGVDWPFKLWGRVRLLGQPTASTGGVISAFQDPNGQIKNLDTQKVGQAVDFVVGTDYQIKRLTSASGRYSMHLITGIGATSPLSSEDVVNKFKVPLKASPQCTDVVSKFSARNGYPVGLILPNSDPASTNCLANGITVLAFNRQERSSFLRKYGAGIRIIDRFRHADASGVPDKLCCERGMVDFVVGQDEAITGGVPKGLVFRIDGVHPLPIKNQSYLYLFGTASIRVSRNNDSRAIILDADTSGSTPSAANVALLPLKQPNKDFYRFGVGLDISKLFSKMFP
jgi:hypothetical protein